MGRQHRVGLDVSLDTTPICIIDNNGAVVWRGKCATEPDAISLADSRTAKIRKSWGKGEIEPLRRNPRQADIDSESGDLAAVASMDTHQVWQKTIAWRKYAFKPAAAAWLTFVSKPRETSVSGKFLFSLVGIVLAVASGMTLAKPANAQKTGITHVILLKNVLPDTANQEVTVYETTYAPGAINPRHMHPAAVTFDVLSGTGIWQEEGKAPITLHAGESLFVPIGTIHSHWNPSATEVLRFLEFMVAEKGKGHSIPRP
jgi:quercetin dioxygenase-like cupin family protein